MGTYWELRGALVGGAIGSGIGPFGEQSFDKAFSFATGPRGE